MESKVNRRIRYSPVNQVEMMSGIVARDVPIGAGVIPVVEFGEGERPVVVIPGVSLFPIAPSAPSIRDRYRFACDDWRFYVLDRRLDTARGCTVESLAAEAAEALEIMGVRGACVFGASMGGMIAQVIAARFPHLVSRLALVSTVSRPGESGLACLDSWGFKASANDSAGLAQSFAEVVYSEGFVCKYAHAFENLFSKATPEDFARFEACVSAVRAFDGRPLAKDVKVPTKVFAGERDCVFPLAETSALASELGTAIRVYPRASHALYDEEDSFPHDLMEFFGE